MTKIKQIEEWELDPKHHPFVKAILTFEDPIGLTKAKLIGFDGNSIEFSQGTIEICANPEYNTIFEDLQLK